MANTRIPPFTSLGVWAENAPPPPGVPLSGTAYRNDALTQPQNEEGEPYDSIPDSANFNQKMYIITRFLNEIDQHGTVGWSDEVDYIAHPPTNVLAVITWADDGAFYQAVQESGPGTGNGVQDPALDVGAVYWKKITSASTLELDLSDQNPGTEGARLVGTTGQTVQSDLDFLNDRAFKLHNLTLGFAGSFGEDGILLGNGFNIKDNLAEIIMSGGFTYFRITLIDNFSQDFIISVTANRPTDTSNLLTSNSFVVVGPWSTPGVVIDNSDTIKIIFTDPYNISNQQSPPFSIIGEMISTS